jgi:5'-nucleotidase
MTRETPVILVDMDGVLAAFDRAYFEMCAELGFEVDCELLDRKHRYSDAHIIDPAHRDLAYEEVCSPGWFISLPPEEGAIDGFHDLAELADLWICTKPMEANPTCRDEKARWIRAHLGKEWESRLILAPDKSMIRGDVLLDDAPKPRWVPRAEWRPVIFPHSFNGPGSKWESFPRWQWGDDPQALVDLALGGK